MKNPVINLTQAELSALKIELEAEYSEFASRNLALNMARGKPSSTLLDHNTDVLATLDNPYAADGTDARNYGILEGLPEMRNFFGEVLGIREGGGKAFHQVMPIPRFWRYLFSVFPFDVFIVFLVSHVSCFLSVVCCCVDHI
jgi:hypothetical protein